MFSLIEANPPALNPVKLNATEKKLLHALGNATLTGEALASRANYPYNSNMKQTLSSLVKRKILGNKGSGYYRL